MLGAVRDEANSKHHDTVLAVLAGARRHTYILAILALSCLLDLTPLHRLRDSHATQSSGEFVGSTKLNQAIAIREEIEKLETELGRMLSGKSRSAAAPGTKKRKRKMSAAARARISAAMKARWAKRKGKK